MRCWHLCVSTPHDFPMDDEGGLIQLEIQDRSRWDRDLMGSGFHFLEKSSMGKEMSKYHLEAGIAALHCVAPNL